MNVLQPRSAACEWDVKVNTTQALRFYIEMANLSQEDRNIILEYPLDTSLDHLRELLRKTEQSDKPSSLSFDGAADSPDFGP